ncbi:Protein of unknown function [Catalinimonas alkaloidigena]|uniref:DUF3078 domain-containing protein n=1 Tax=Catalinimonas alkaloidigena TaxID=1075417 RepID=A0A1G8XKE1_9BACT|nr:DUF3078 domain-containing protein [Catalinimonas alkaloidigena]SDJ91041.1 Protein of unknown function [Catalinimonas alkaloidigena]
MKKLFVLSLFFLVCAVQAQDTDTTYWKRSLKIGLNFNQAAFSSNWKAGGVNSIALGSLFQTTANYEKDKVSWNNIVDLQFGVVRNQGQGVRKTADLLFLDTKVGRNLSEKWDLFAAVNFISQFAAGYKYPANEPRQKISDFLAPAFLTAAWGFDYKPVDYFHIRFSPFAPRLTIVNDTSLYRNVPQNYGVEVGEKTRMEWLATQILAELDKNLADNLNLKARYLLFANLETFGFKTIDHRLDVALSAKITKYIDVSLTGIILYDSDQDANIQASQTLALGLLYAIPAKK